MQSVSSFRQEPDIRLRGARVGGAVAARTKKKAANQLGRGGVRGLLRSAIVFFDFAHDRASFSGSWRYHFPVPRWHRTSHSRLLASRSHVSACSRYNCRKFGLIAVSARVRHRVASPKYSLSFSMCACPPSDNYVMVSPGAIFLRVLNRLCQPVVVLCEFQKHAAR